MNTTIKKNIFAILIITGFFLLGVASNAKKLGYVDYQNWGPSEEESPNGNYLETNEGEKIYGKNIDWASGLISKGTIEIDGKNHKIADIKGYYIDRKYYGRYGGGYILRIIHGKINVYSASHLQQVGTGNQDITKVSTPRMRTVYMNYAQKGENGELIYCNKLKTIQELVQDCPLAYSMANISGKEAFKMTKKEKDYMNQIFQVYNNDCKPLK